MPEPGDSALAPRILWRGVRLLALLISLFFVAGEVTPRQVERTDDHEESRDEVVTSSRRGASRASTARDGAGPPGAGQLGRSAALGVRPHGVVRRSPSYLVPRRGPGDEDEDDSTVA